MKKIIVISILCVLLWGCRRDNILIESKITSTPNDVVKILENEMAVLIICPTGTMEETFSIEFSKDRVLTTTLGTRKDIDISAIRRYKKNDFYLRIEKKESVTLSDNEFCKIDKLIDKIGTEDNSRYKNCEDIWYDSWINVLLTSKEVYYFDDIDMDSSIFELYDFFYEKSPFEIDLHGWS